MGRGSHGCLRGNKKTCQWGWHQVVMGGGCLLIAMNNIKKNGYTCRKVYMHLMRVCIYMYIHMCFFSKRSPARRAAANVSTRMPGIQ